MMGKVTQICRLLARLCFLPRDFAVYIWGDKTWRIVALLYLTTFSLVIPLLCINMPNSLYFIKTEDKKSNFEEVLRNQNTERIAKAEKYLATLNRTKLGSALEKAGERLNIFIAVITVSRNRHKIDQYEPRYLSQVVWKLLETLHVAMSKGFRRSVKIAVCNVDKDPKTYEEAVSLGINIPVINRYQKTAFPIDHPLETEKQDYVFCLNTTLQQNPVYSLLIEDDAIPYDDFFTVLDYILTNRVEHAHDHLDHMMLPYKQNVTFIKLYHPERLLGYINLEQGRIPELIGIGLLFGTLLYKIFVGFCPYKPRSHAALWFLMAAYCALTALAIGRANLVELRRSFSPYLYTYVNAPECCTPAMLFPYDGAQNVLAYLDATEAHKNYAKDIILEDMKRNKHIHTYMVQPNLVKHIGLYSTIRSRIVDPFVV